MDLKPMGMRPIPLDRFSNKDNQPTDVGTRALGPYHLIKFLYHQVSVVVFLALNYVNKFLQDYLNKFLQGYLNKFLQDKLIKMLPAGCLVDALLILFKLLILGVGIDHLHRPTLLQLNPMGCQCKVPRTSSTA